MWENISSSWQSLSLYLYLIILSQCCFNVGPSFMIDTARQTDISLTEKKVITDLFVIGM